ncbi:hypothetical protein FRC07_006366 [Ceratobasidium sp. 392]|nr:hypothetical protein FRC07_006366 [Ceratobasidium sp. 392]
MDSPLTTAELSRLRKAINQRERLLSQGLSIVGAESNIARALSNLKLFLPQSQAKIAAALKDWESADQATKTRIALWLRQDILGEQTPPTEAPISTVRTQTLAPHAKFVAPPPPPPLPKKAHSLPPRSQHSQNASVSSFNVSPRSTSPRPLPPPNHSPLRHTNSLRHSQTTFTPTSQIRELHTQATLRSPTPPPKDYPESRSSSFIRNIDPVGTEQLALNTQRINTATSANNPQPSFSASPVTSFPPSHSESPTPTNETHFGIFNNPYLQSSDSNDRVATYPQAELNPPRLQPQIQYPHQSFSLDGHSNLSHQLPTPPLVQSQPDFMIQLPNLASSYQQQNQNFIPQAVQSTAQLASQSPPRPGVQATSSGNTNYLSSAMKKFHSLATQFQSRPQSQAQSQLPVTQPAPNNGDSFQQLLVAYQQQQQQQTNQILAALQQQQQFSPAFDPAQILAQSQQQNQDFLNALAQMQANSAPALGPTQYASQSMDYMNMLAQMQSNTPGVDLGSVMAGAGGGVDWTSVAGMATSGVDPSSMAEAFATQSSGLF